MANQLFNDIKRLNAAALTHLAQDVALADWDRTPAAKPCEQCEDDTADTPPGTFGYFN
jgi:hypothetical protein